MTAPTPVSLSLMDILQLAVSTGVIASVTTQVIAWLIERSRSKRSSRTQATYLAARLAVIFEHFAIECAEQVADNDMYQQSGGHAGKPHGQLPKLGELPSEANWTTLDPILLSRSLSLPNELLLGERMIAFWSDIDHEPSLLRNACDAQAGICGYRAWQLAEELRSRYGLPDFVPRDFSWDVIKTLKQRHDREQVRIRQNQASTS